MKLSTIAHTFSDALDPRTCAIAAALIAIASCSGDKVVAAPKLCVPGQQLECPCPGGAKGVQACRDDGSGFDLCVCVGGSAGTGGAGARAGTGGAGGGGTAGAGGVDTDAAIPGQDAASADDAPEAGGSRDGNGHDAEHDTSDATIADASEDFPSADAACVGEPIRGEKKQSDLYMMIDNSGSMNEVDMGQTITRWQNLGQAIPVFVNDPANVDMMVGLDFFPEGGNNPSCNVMDYTMANVPIDLLPGPNGMQANAIIAAVNGRTRSGGTPTTPALTGAIEAARTWQIAHPDRSLSVLFITDGEPTDCNPNTVATASAAARAGFMGTPPIRTYVLGIGPSTGNLDSIAAAGGTTMAYMVTNGGAAALATALATIRKSTLSCDYSLPRIDGGALDPSKINVDVRVGPAPAPYIPVFNAGTAAGCTDVMKNPKGEGWYYDTPPPGTPTKITLCPNSCGPLQITDGSDLNVLLGCVTKSLPPPS